VLRYLRLALQAAPLLLAGTFTIALVLAAQLGLFGIPLAVILVFCFFKYCFVLLDAAIAGEREAPVLSLEMCNPLDELRPLAQLLLLLIGVALVLYLRSLGGTPVLVASALLLIALLPAHIALLAVSHSPLHALSPRALHAFMRGLGRDYFALVLALLAATACAYGLWLASAPLAVPIALSQLAFLTLFAFTGGIIHKHRLLLGIEIRSVEERAAERVRSEHLAERHRMLDRAHTQVRLRRIPAAWHELEQWIAAHGRGGHAWREYAALLEAASMWDDPRVADLLADDYLAQLLTRRENGMALEVLAHRLASHAGYRPASPEHARRLAELARLAGKAALERQLTTAAGGAAHQPHARRGS